MSHFLRGTRALILPEVGRIWAHPDLNASKVAGMPLGSISISTHVCWFSSVATSSYFDEMHPTDEEGEEGGECDKCNNDSNDYMKPCYKYALYGSRAILHEWKNISTKIPLRRCVLWLTIHTLTQKKSQKTPSQTYFDKDIFLSVSKLRIAVNP